MAAMTEERRPLERSKLAAIVESTFPLPIAVAFAQMRLSAEAKEMQPLAGLLDATVRHLAIVSANDALAGSAISEGRTALVAAIDNFKKPLPPAKWLEVLRLSLRALDQEERKPIVPGLDDWFRANARKLEEAVELRLRGRADYTELARMVLHLLATLALLRDTRLAWIDRSSKNLGMHTALLLWLDGVQSAKGAMVLSEPVETDLVYVIAPGSRTLLSLEPLYRVARCPECTETHLFQLDERRRAELRFTAVGFGHHMNVADRPPSLRRFLRGHRGRRQLDRLVIPLERTPPTFARGEVVGKRHRIQRVLRDAGLGHRYEAADQVTHRTVALEVLPHRLVRDPTIIERVCKESAEAKSLSHAHLVPILDEGVDGGDHYLAVELPTGWPIENGGRALDVSELPKPVSAKVALAIAKQALEGLAFLHGRGIVHGDVKPSSLLLFNGGVVKIGDYAFSKARASILVNLTGQTADPKYMSPEQAEGDLEIDARADLYSLGALLDELIGDRRNAPAVLADAIAKALENDPDRRHLSAPIFLEALEPGRRALATSGQNVAGAWFEILESREPTLRPGDRIPLPENRVATIGGDKCTIAIAGLPAMAAILQWSENDRAFTIRHGGLSPTIPIHTTVDGQVLPHFEDAAPYVVHDRTAIVVQSLGRPILSVTFRIAPSAPPAPALAPSPAPAQSSSFVKFRCHHCDAQHLIARAKLRARTTKTHCKRCSKEIFIVV
jgi:hypothetical protein